MLSPIRNRLRRNRYQSVPVVMSTAALSLTFLLPEHAARAQAVDLGNGRSAAQAVRSQPIVPDAAPRPAWMDETGVAAYFSNWFRRVARAQSQQPNWIAGIVPRRRSWSSRFVTTSISSTLAMARTCGISGSTRACS